MKINYNNLRIIIIIRWLWHRFCNDSLFRNSIYLMLSTGVMAIFGFIFWIITSHFYTSEQIGLATALISITILLTNLSLFGFNSALIRYLPQTKNPNVMINTAMVIVAAITVVISTIYLLGIDYFAPVFHLLVETPSYAFLFVVFMISVSLNTLTDSVFIAYRYSKYNLIVYTFFGLTKIILPFLFIGYGAYGIFFSYSGAVIVAFGLSIYFMMQKFDFRPTFVINKNATKQMTRFSLANYIAAFLSGLPTLIAPILIVNELGAADSAYFYMASTIAALLYVIPQAITQSLFAEGSHKEKDLGVFVKKAIKLIGILLIPAIIVIFIFSNFVLLIFGTEYSVNGYQLLQIMSLTGIFLAINLIGTTIIKIRHQMKKLLIVNTGYLIFTLMLIYFMIQNGLAGVCWALFTGQLFLSIIFIAIFSKNIKKLFF